MAVRVLTSYSWSFPSRGELQAEMNASLAEEQEIMVVGLSYPRKDEVRKK